MSTLYPWSRMPIPYYMALDDAGVPLPGAKLYFYNSGTSTPHDTFFDADQEPGDENTNPVVADAAGMFSSIFLEPNVEYKVVLTDANDVEQWTADPVSVSNGDGAGATGSLTIGLEHTFNGGGAAPDTGVTGDLLVPFACTVTGWHFMADQSGSAVLDIWKKPFVTNSPPTIANTMTGSAKPTIAAATSATSTTLTGWTTAIAANDHLRFNLDSVSTLTFATLVLTCTRTISVS